MDTDWIKNYEEDENKYKKFYKEDVNIIDLVFIYINNDNEVYNVKNFKEFIANSQITCERIIELVKKYQINLNTKHRLMSILNYKIDIDCDNIKQLFNFEINPGTLYSIKNINNINFDKTVTFLEDINSIFFIFREQSNTYNNTYNSNTNNNKNSIKNPGTTRKVFINNAKHKKTKRKYT